MAGRNPAWGLTGGVGEVGEKLHGVERNPWIASVGAGTAGGGGATEQQLRRRGHAAPAALRRGRSGEDRPERTSGRWRTDSEGSRGWRMAGGGGSTAGLVEAAVMADSEASWAPWVLGLRSGRGREWRA